MSDSIHYGTFGQVNLKFFIYQSDEFYDSDFIPHRIHGINWSHKQETHLTTASQDGTVKYFCINNPRRAEKIITTSSPVWRARFTVFNIYTIFN